jgi:hypothetical protein
MKKQLLNLGGTILLSALSITSKAQATFQIIHNCADAAATNVKIWANGGVLVNNLSFRFATPVGTVTAGSYTIGVSLPTATSQAQSLAQFTVNFASGVDYKIVANGIVSAAGYLPNNTVAPFTLNTFTTSGLAAPGATQTKILVNHGSTDAPTVDVVAPFTGAVPVIPNVLVNNAAYTNFSNWLTVNTADIKLQVRDQFSENVVAEYSAPLQTLGLGGSILTVVASGFLTPASNSAGPAFGLWVAAATGGSLIPLPTTTVTSTRLQAIHNSADAGAAQVDVWLKSTATGTSAILIADNFAFRTATPFVDIPTAQVVTLSIAPPTSTSAAAAIANFTYNLLPTSKYQLIATGLISPTGYSPSATVAPFGLAVNPNVRERAITASNTDVLIFHGSTDAPAVNVLENSGIILASNLAYNSYNSSGYNLVPTSNYSVTLTNTAGTATVANYLAPLSTLSLTGSAITVLASGFLNTAANNNGPSFGLWAALATGGNLVQLSTYTVTALSKNSKLNDLLSVYPNPFSNVLIIKNKSNSNLAITILDINGKVIVNQTSTLETIELNTNELTNGVYFLNITNGEYTSNYKVVK